MSGFSAVGAPHRIVLFGSRARGDARAERRRELNLNVHVHALVLDGVFARNRAGALNFHPAPRLTALDVAEVLATVEPRIKRLLDRRGLGDGDDDGPALDTWADEAPVPAAAHQPDAVPRRAGAPGGVAV